MTATEYQPKPKRTPENLEIHKKGKEAIAESEKTPDIERDYDNDSLQDMDPRPMTPSDSDRCEPANTGSRRQQVTHDKLWLYGFLIHVIAYMSASAYINYLSISTVQQPIAEDHQGPIDVYVFR
jgi:hypothetical protein